MLCFKWRDAFFHSVSQLSNTKIYFMSLLQKFSQVQYCEEYQLFANIQVTVGSLEQQRSDSPVPVSHVPG